MGIDALLISSSSGARLLARHFGSKTVAERLLFERAVVEHAKLYSGGARRTMTVQGHTVLVTPVGELLMHVVGSGQDGDELVLAQVADLVQQLLEEHLEHRLTATDLLNPEALGKVYVSLDEMISDGAIECLNIDYILKLSKMKAL